MLLVRNVNILINLKKKNRENINTFVLESYKATSLNYLKHFTRRLHLGLLEELDLKKERENAITFGGKPVTLIGQELKVGDIAPDFITLSENLQPYSLNDDKGSVRFISVIASIDAAAGYMWYANSSL